MTITEPDAIDTEATEHHDGEAPPEIHRQAVELATATTHAVSAHTIGGSELSVVPMRNEIEALAQFAVTLAASGTAPRALQGKPNDCFMVMLTARDLGVALTTAVREFHVIDGKVTLSPKVKLAMVRQQGHGKVYPHQAPRQVLVDGEWREQKCPCGTDDAANDDQRATWHAERADEPGILHSSTFTMDMAKRVKAKENGTAITLDQKSTWKAYPQRMLSWRALGYLLDDVFSEVGTGLYSPDEMGAVTDEDGVPIIDVVAHAEPVRGTSAPRGHNAPPPPPEPPADDDALEGLRSRIAALAVLPEARTALVELWTKPRGEEGSTEPTLPALDRLMARQVKMADAMVASIEARARKGEWGDWSQDATSEPTVPQDATPAQPVADTANDAVSESAPAAAARAELADQQAAHAAQQGDEITTEVIAEVKAMEPSEVTARLTKMNLATDGRLDTKRHRLASAMITERRSQE